MPLKIMAHFYPLPFKSSLSRASWLIRLVFIPSFCGIKQLRIILFLQDRMPVYRRLLPSICWYPFIPLGGERQVKSSVLPKDTIHGQQLDSNPGPSDLKLQTLTTAPCTSERPWKFFIKLMVTCKTSSSISQWSAPPRGCVRDANIHLKWYL